MEWPHPPTVPFCYGRPWRVGMGYVQSRRCTQPHGGQEAGGAAAPRAWRRCLRSSSIVCWRYRSAFAV
jgi:hypothetical protein